MERNRLFIAINPPEETKEKLAFFQKKWPEVPAKWTEKENLHITLSFLGNVPAGRYEQMKETVSRIAQKTRAFPLDIVKISYDPSKRMIWAVIKNSKDLISLKKDIEASRKKIENFKTPGKRFSPHITLARIKSLDFRRMDYEEIPEINEKISLAFTAGSIEIMKSDLEQKGPKYTILKSISFFV